MSLPPLFLERIQNILPASCDIKGCFCPLSQGAFRINTLKADRDEIKQALKGLNIAFNPVPWYEDALTVAQEDYRRVLDCGLVKDGKLYAQGLESMLPVLVLDPKPGEAVLDVCAAPGSKTTQIAAHMNNEGFLAANEPVKDRFYRLRSVVDLLGAKVKLMLKDGRYLRSDNMFDRILVDAPCSSEGRFKHDDSKSHGYWSLRKIHEMAHKQKGLLLNASRLLKKGGVMVYSTCTFAPEENEAVLDWFLRKTNGEFKVVPIELKGIAYYPILDQWQEKPFDPQVKAGLRVLPSGNMEGFFMAKLIKA